MLLCKEVLSIRVSGKERKKKVRTLLLELAHFRNLLIIFIRKYKDIYNKILLHQSILYGLLSKKYTGKYQSEFNEVMVNINNNTELTELLDMIKKQKEKVDNAHFVQYIVRQVIKDFTSYFHALQKYSKEPGKFKGKPRPPKPKKLKYIMNISAEANNNTFKIEDSNIAVRLKEGKYLKVKLPKNFQYTISSVRLKLFGSDLYVDVVYERQIQQQSEYKEYKAGIDIGLDELLSIVSENPEIRSFIISGKEIKSFNQWFNKERAKLRSQIDYLKNEIKSGDYEDTARLERKLKELEMKERSLSSHRKRWLDNNLHKISRKIVDLLYQTGHNIIYIGKNAIESKDGIDLGRRINQHFVSIPFRRLVELIKYKANRLGINVIEVDESYTSKTSPFADILKIQNTKNKSLCKGERERNTFKDFFTKKIFHADLVGALNILRVGAKLHVLNFYNNLKVLFIKLCNPFRFKLIDFLYQVSPESLWIGSSKQGFISSAGWTREIESFGYV